MSFRSLPGCGIDSSINLGMPRNDHFLPRNNGKSFFWVYSAEFFRNEIPLPTLLLTNESLRTREGEIKPHQINANDCALKASWSFQLQVANVVSSFSSTGHYFCMETYCDSTVYKGMKFYSRIQNSFEYNKNTSGCFVTVKWLYSSV